MPGEAAPASSPRMTVADSPPPPHRQVGVVLEGGGGVAVSGGEGHPQLGAVQEAAVAGR